MTHRPIQITAYIRDEADLAKWKAISNKTQWLHERLNGQTEWVGKTGGFEVQPFGSPPPKCAICGDYHYPNDPQYLPGGTYAHKPEDPTYEPMEPNA